MKKRELCTLCFRHLDTKPCWSRGKVASCGIKGCALAHSSLLLDGLQNEDVMMMVSTSTRIAGGQESVLRCRQVVAIENGGQCFRIAVLHDWGATASMVTREAANTLGLLPSKQTTKVIRDLGSMTVKSRIVHAVPLVARNALSKHWTPLYSVHGVFHRCTFVRESNLSPADRSEGTDGIIGWNFLQSSRQNNFLQNHILCAAIASKFLS